MRQTLESGSPGKRERHRKPEGALAVRHSKGKQKICVLWKRLSEEKV